MDNQPIAVLGVGSWGYALALVLADNHVPVRLWGHRIESMRALFSTRENKYLPGFPLPDTVEICYTLDDALRDVAGILIVVPSDALIPLLEKIKPNAQIPIAWGTKGLGNDAELLSSQAAQILGKQAKLCVISGPSFAKEVVQKQPTAVTAASADDSAYFWQKQLHNDYFRVYTSTDIIGAQLGGAFKNVLAIAVGIAEGLGLGSNARAALMTRGFAELLRLGRALNAQDDTLMGLSGIGDLILTCSENQSRNRRFGLGLGQGKNAQDLKREIGQVVEGEHTAKLVYQLAQRLKINMPITEQMYQILYEGKDAKSAVKALLERAPTDEFSG